MIDFKEIVAIVMGVLAVGSALIVVFHRNIIYSAFSLILTFFGMAGLFVCLSADFVAGVQVLVYIGGVLILILFAIMLSHKLFGESLLESQKKLIPAFLLVIPFLLVVLYVVFNTEWGVVQERASLETVAQLGNLLLDRYVLPFELASVLLLGALVGAVYLVRSE